MDWIYPLYCTHLIHCFSNDPLDSFIVMHPIIWWLPSKGHHCHVYQAYMLNLSAWNFELSILELDNKNVSMDNIQWTFFKPMYIEPKLVGSRKIISVNFRSTQFWILFASTEAFRNCLRQRYFTSPRRGIGYSFQLAITAPLYSITGYCIATAQS